MDLPSLNHASWDSAERTGADLKAGSVNIIEFLIAIYNHRGLVEQLQAGCRTVPCYTENCARAD